MKKLFLALALMAVCCSSFAQTTIFHFSNGSLQQEAVTNTISGDFVSLSVQGGFVPLSLDKGVLDWGGPAIETVGELFWKGSVSPSASGLAADPNWWAGPVIGIGQAGSTSISTHGIAGLTAGINLGSVPLSATAVVDTATGTVYGGLSLVTQIDLGSGSIIQVH